MKHITKKIKQKKRSILPFSFSKERGISLLFVVLISGVILAIGLGLSAILVQQIRMMGEVGYSVIAFYAADSGAEEILYDLYQPFPHIPQDYHQGFCGDASFESLARCSFTPVPEAICPSDFETDENCLSDNFCIYSTGTYKKTKRALELKY